MTTNTTRYKIRTGPEHYSGTRPWMVLASTTGVNCKSVGAWCYYEAETVDPTALEAALEADDDVIEYATKDAMTLIKEAGYGSADWERDQDNEGGWVLDVGGDTQDDIARCISALESVGLKVSFNRVSTTEKRIWVTTR